MTKTSIRCTPVSSSMNPTNSTNTFVFVICRMTTSPINGGVVSEPPPISKIFSLWLPVDQHAILHVIRSLQLKPHGITDQQNLIESIWMNASTHIEVPRKSR